MKMNSGKLVLFIGLTCCGLCPSLAVSAKESNWYVGGALSQARLDIDSGVLKSAYDAGLFDNRLDGGEIFAGYVMKPWLALESSVFIRYMSELTWRGYGNELRTSGLTLSTKFTSKQYHGLALYVKPGVGITSSKAELKNLNNAAYSETKNTVHPNMATGLEYSFSRRIAANIGYEYQYHAVSLADEKYSQSIVGLGVRYHF